MKILICGLPNSGKTWLAMRMAGYFNCPHFNADKVRAMVNDWSFDMKARFKQANRLKAMADFEHSPTGGKANLTITDFVCPTEVTRSIFQPGMIIYMNTLSALGIESPYQDTNNIFEPPEDAHIVVESLMDDFEIYKMCKRIKEEFKLQVELDDF